MDSRYPVWAARWRVPLGFAFSLAYIVFAQPTRGFLRAGAAIAVLGLALRAWAAGHLEKNRTLATTGPYAYTRNPLYLGSFLLGAGFSLAGGSWLLAAAFLVFFFLVYWPVMLREEASLHNHFGEAYEGYAKAVPLFFPNGRKAPASEASFRCGRYRKNREYQAALGSLAGFIFLVLKSALR